LADHPEVLAFVRLIEVTLWPNHPDVLAFMRFIEDTL